MYLLVMEPVPSWLFRHMIPATLNLLKNSDLPIDCIMDPAGADEELGQKYWLARHAGLKTGFISTQPAMKKEFPSTV